MVRKMEGTQERFSQLDHLSDFGKLDGTRETFFTNSIISTSIENVMAAQQATKEIVLRDLNVPVS